MNDTAMGFQEDWAASFTRRMVERIVAARSEPEVARRRGALEDALELGKEARLRVESGRTDNSFERQALSNLQEALDEVQQLLNAVDPCYEPLIDEAAAHAEAAADALNAAPR